jgi:PPIC-type PPIASE domain
MRRGGILLLAFCAGGCGDQPERRITEPVAPPAIATPAVVAADATVAVVDGRPITASAVRREILRRGGDFLQHYGKLEEKERLVDDLVRTRVLAAAARRSGIADDPEIQEAYDKLLADRYWRAQVHERTRTLTVPDADVEAYYRTHPAEFTEPERVRGAVIFLEWRPGASAAERADVRAKASRLAAEAATLPADEPGFGRLAAEHSDHAPTRGRGGDTGFILKSGSVYHLALEAVNALVGLTTPGSLAPLVETDAGVWLVKLAARRGGERLPLDGVAETIRTKLLAIQTAEIERATVDELRRTFAATIDREVLATVGPTVTAAASGPPSFPLGEATR